MIWSPIHWTQTNIFQDLLFYKREKMLDMQEKIYSGKSNLKEEFVKLFIWDHHCFEASYQSHQKEVLELFSVQTNCHQSMKDLRKEEVLPIVWALFHLRPLLIDPNQLCHQNLQFTQSRIYIKAKIYEAWLLTSQVLFENSIDHLRHRNWISLDKAYSPWVHL